MTDPIPTTKTLTGIPALRWCNYTQQKDNHISQLSRRSLVTSAAALPALAVPAVALADNPDAELVRLAVQFENYRPIYGALLADYNEKAATANHLAFERADAIVPPGAQLLHAEMMRAWAETGAGEASRKLSAAEIEFYAIINKIMDTPCHTIAGLRAKALVAIHVNDRLWGGPK